MDIERNPPGAEGVSLQALNVCFPGWGDERAFAWAFRRTCGGPPADLLLVREAGELIAGSAVSYRQLVTASGARALVGIMTGSWTLPAARGRGAFSRIIEESLALTADRGGALLLAFVTEQNASFRRLQAAGATLYPTRYVTSTPGAAPRPPARLLEHDAAAARSERWFHTFERLRAAGAHFAYDDLAAWAGQHLERPSRPTLLEVPGAGAALVETHGDFDRVQALAADGDEARREVIAAALGRAQAAGRRLFLFESQPARAARLQEQLPLDAAPGALTALATQRGAVDLAGGWALDSGDRM